jgi:putative glutamine amidotransferase
VGRTDAPVRIVTAAPRFVGISSYARVRTGATEQKFSIPTGYVDAVRAAGAVPIVLPSGDPRPEQLLAPLSALIVSGGGDIEPSVYGGRSHAAVYAVCNERDAFEIGLTRAALADTRVPMLCICRGLQVLNVVCGGTLHVHLPDVVGDRVTHRAPERSASRHHVRLDPDSRLAAILGTTACEVASWHHQAIERLGDHPWCIAVQWHPEMPPDDPVQQRLFRALVASPA